MKLKHEFYLGLKKDKESGMIPSYQKISIKVKYDSSEDLPYKLIMIQNNEKISSMRMSHEQFRRDVCDSDPIHSERDIKRAIKIMFDENNKKAK